MKTTKVAAMVAALLGTAAASGTAAAFSLADCGGGVACPWVQYGDAQSYNLAVNASLYDTATGVGTGPGNPFYVTSTPGAIQDLVVNATGSSGTGVTTNIAGMDGAYATPTGTGGAPFFTTNKTAYGIPVTGQVDSTIAAPVDPDPNTGLFWDTQNTWDTSVAALQTFLGTGNVPIFFFNNNQTNSGTTADQSVAVWAQITLTDSTGTNATKVFDFINISTTGAAGGSYFQNPLGGGTLFGDVANYTHTGATGVVNAGNNDSTDYVLSGGQTCFNPTTGQLALPVAGSCPAGFTQTINSNLGANQAAYAVLFPELNALLLAGGYDALHVDFRYGCDPNTTDGSDAGTAVDCLARSANNGYEQLFMGAITPGGVLIPEPTTLALMGLALAGLGLARRKGLSAA